MKGFFHSYYQALRNCKKSILAIFSVYCISCFVGIIMAHAGNSIDLAYRDKIVEKANANSNATDNYKKGNKFKAAVIDFSENLFIGSIPQTLLGLGVVIPFFTTSYQGWIGGIVSVDNRHQSRLTKTKPALYYFLVLILQFIPYSLTIGSGVTLGIKTYKLNKERKFSQYRIDKHGLKDVFTIYVIAVPLFFLASCFEFLSNWNTISQ